MNIHFNDKKLFHDLIDCTVATFKIGSHMYGLQNEVSDTDYLHIYLEPNSVIGSFMWEHHQLQYTEHGVDHNFTTLQNFIRNTLSGDSTINFEILFSKDLVNSRLDWLEHYKYDFINYNIIKSYLGMAKRDLKFYLKDTKQYSKHTIETDKKLSHFVRGIIFAKMAIDGSLNLDMNTTTFGEFKSDLELLKQIKLGKHSMHKDVVVFFEAEMNNLRDELNSRLNNKLIHKYMDPFIAKDIDKITKHSQLQAEYSNTTVLDYGYLFYDALEHGIKY